MHAFNTETVVFFRTRSIYLARMPWFRLQPISSDCAFPPSK